MSEITQAELQAVLGLPTGEEREVANAFAELLGGRHPQRDDTIEFLIRILESIRTSLLVGPQGRYDVGEAASAVIGGARARYAGEADLGAWYADLGLERPGGGEMFDYLAGTAVPALARAGLVQTAPPIDVLEARRGDRPNPPGLSSSSGA